MPRHPDKANDGFERSISLQDREEYLVGALVLRRPVAQRDAAKVERRAGDRIKQLFTRRIA